MKRRAAKKSGEESTTFIIPPGGSAGNLPASAVAAWYYPTCPRCGARQSKPKVGLARDEGPTITMAERYADMGGEGEACEACGAKVVLTAHLPWERGEGVR